MNKVYEKEMKYEIKPLTDEEEDAEIIGKGLGAFCEEVVPDKHELEKRI